MKIDKILERYQQNPDQPMSGYFGVDAGAFKGPANELVARVKQLGGDLDWWFAPKEQIPLLPSVPGRGTKIQGVVGGLGYSFGTVMELVNLKVQRDFKIAMGAATDAMDARKHIEHYRSRGSPPIRPEELAGLAREYFKDHQEKIMAAFQEVRAKLSAAAGDVVVWVCELLKQHGRDDVDVKTYFWASSVFIRVYQAQTKSLFEKTMKMFGGRGLG